ncbi:hypothetical protein TrVGV298_002262 [Trichoderma virens]|nr:hypothetical protein TrVGV298_002262 [Trichoderma virens]
MGTNTFGATGLWSRNWHRELKPSSILRQRHQGLTATERVKHLVWYSGSLDQERMNERWDRRLVKRSGRRISAESKCKKGLSSDANNSLEQM